MGTIRGRPTINQVPVVSLVQGHPAAMPPSWAYAPWPVGAALADVVQALAQRIRRDAAV